MKLLVDLMKSNVEYTMMFKVILIREIEFFIKKNV